MEKKCYRCGSTNVAKVVSANSVCIPEVQKDLLEGRAVMSCCCAGTGGTDLYRCKDCSFEWDYFYELGMEQHKTTNDALKNTDVDNKNKWWKKLFV